MPVRRVAGDEHAALLHMGRPGVVDGPVADPGHVDVEVRIADEGADDPFGLGVGHLEAGLVDVVAPDRQPPVPWPHHPHHAHADAADVRSGLHHPVEDAGAVGDVWRQVRVEEEVDRPADAHPPLYGHPDILGHLGVAAVGAHEVARADRDLAPRQPVEAGGRHAVLVLLVAQVLGGHARLRAARAGGLEEEGLHVGLRQVVHARGRGAQVRGLALGRGAPSARAAQLLPGQRGAERVGSHQFLGGGLGVGLGLDLRAEVAQHLHRALVGDLRARRVRQPAIAVDRHVLDAVGRQQRGRGPARRPGADDQHIGRDVRGHVRSFRVDPPVRRRRTGKSRRPVRSEIRPQSPHGASSVTATASRPSSIR